MKIVLTIRDRVFEFLLPTLAKNWIRSYSELNDQCSHLLVERDFLKNCLTDIQLDLSNSRQDLLDDRAKIIDSLCWAQHQPGIYSQKVSPMFEKQQEAAERMAEMGPGISRGRGGRGARARNKTRDFFEDYKVGPEKPLATQIHAEPGEPRPNLDPEGSFSSSWPSSPVVDGRSQEDPDMKEKEKGRIA